MRLILKPMKTVFSPRKPAVQDFFDEKGFLLLAKGQPPRKQAEYLNSRQVYSLHYEWNDQDQPQETASDSSCCPQDQIISERICPWIQPIYHKTGLLDSSMLIHGILFVDQLIQELEAHPIIAQDFEALKSYDNYTYIHSINVALLSFALGKILEYKGEKLKRLVLGALLHDIGKISIPVSIINKPMTLSAEEFSLIQTHPTRGFQRSSDFFLPRSVLAVILEHHERWNGCGYPRGLKQNKIHAYAQIVAVVDVFDALISDRPYRPGLPPYHAIEMILKRSETEFSSQVIEAFLKALTVYPENSRVILDTGESGVVMGYSYTNLTRPVVRILYDANGNPVQTKKIVDLSKNSKHYIQTVEYSLCKNKEGRL